MNERKTASILQRLSVILAVTAASYGLQFPFSARDLGRAPARHGPKAVKAQVAAAHARGARQAARPQAAEG